MRRLDELIPFSKGRTPLRSAVIVLALLSAMGPRSGVAKDLLVLDSSGPGGPQYQRFSIIAAASLNVPPGATVTVLTDRQQLVRIAGPYSGLPPANATRSTNESFSFTTFAEALKSKLDALTRLIVVRGTDTQEAADLLDIDFTTSGARCVPDSGDRYLWRPKPAKEARYYIEQADGEVRTAFSWPKDSQRIRWPDVLGLRDRTVYLISDERLVARRVEIRLVPAVPTSGALLTRLMELGCNRQFLTGIDTLSEDR